jgi:hypothetical protein
LGGAIGGDADGIRDELREAIITGAMRFYFDWQAGPPNPSKLPEFMRKPLPVEDFWLRLGFS